MLVRMSQWPVLRIMYSVFLKFCQFVSVLFNLCLSHLQTSHSLSPEAFLWLAPLSVCHGFISKTYADFFFCFCGFTPSVTGTLLLLCLLACFPFLQAFAKTPLFSQYLSIKENDNELWRSHKFMCGTRHYYYFITISYVNRWFWFISSQLEKGKNPSPF